MGYTFTCGVHQESVRLPYLQPGNNQHATKQPEITHLNTYYRQVRMSGDYMPPS